MTSWNSTTGIPDYDPASCRAMRGKVRARKTDGRIHLDFWPDLKGGNRFLWSDRGAGFRDKAHAQWVGEEIHRLEASGVPLEDAIGAFRSAKSKPNLVSARLDDYRKKLIANDDLQPNTLDGYMSIIRKHCGFWDGKIMLDIGYDNLEAWRDQLAENELGGKSIRNILTFFKGFLTDHRRRQPRFVIPEFPKVKTQKKKQSRMPLNDIAQVLEAIPEDDRGIFLCLVYTTIRPSEARAQCNRHYDWKTGILNVTVALKTSSGVNPVSGTTKTGETGKYPLPDDLQRWLIAHTPTSKRFDPEAPLFPNPRTGKFYKRSVPTNIWRDACARAEVDYVSLYPATKHSGLTALSEAGYSIEDIQALARHKNSSMTRQYVVEDDEKRARAATALQQLIDDERNR